MLQVSDRGSILIVVYGLPGVGKSTFARLLVKQLSAKYLAIDDVWSSLYLKPSFTKIESDAVFLEFFKLIEENLTSLHGILIVEGIFASHSRINQLAILCQKHTVLFYRILMDASLDILLSRTSIRSHPLSIEKMIWLLENFETKEDANITLDTSKLTIPKLHLLAYQLAKRLGN